jgi:hypothetical protein
MMSKVGTVRSYIHIRGVSGSFTPIFQVFMLKRTDGVVDIYYKSDLSNADPAAVFQSRTSRFTNSIYHRGYS